MTFMTVLFVHRRDGWRCAGSLAWVLRGWGPWNYLGRAGRGDAALQRFSGGLAGFWAHA